MELKTKYSYGDKVVNFRDDHPRLLIIRAVTITCREDHSVLVTYQFNYVDSKQQAPSYVEGDLCRPTEWLGKRNIMLSIQMANESEISKQLIKDEGGII